MTEPRFARNTRPDVVINWFDDFDVSHEHRFLSNFYAAPVKIGAITYSCTEVAYAAAKCSVAEDFYKIALEQDPGKAKRMGRKARLRPDWEEVKIPVMRACLRAKFARGSDMAKRLLDTGAALLIEGTFWNDRVWGVSFDDVGEPGDNWLGTLLMARRAELQLPIRPWPMGPDSDWPVALRTPETDRYVFERAAEIVDRVDPSLWLFVGGSDPVVTDHHVSPFPDGL